MDSRQPFTAAFDRDHVHMTITVSGAYGGDDLESFQAAVVDACRGRRREWTVDAAGLSDTDGPAFVDAMLWLRAEWGHVCLLNPPPDLQAAVREVGADRSIVVRSDARSHVRARAQEPAG